MVMSDPLGDMLTRIRNGQQSQKITVECPASNIKSMVLEVLKTEGFIRGYKKIKDKNDKPQISIELKYFDGIPAIREMTRVSKPGCRIYSSVTDMPTNRNGLGMFIISTPSGVMSDHSARAANVGGEILCKVF